MKIIALLALLLLLFFCSMKSKAEPNIYGEPFLIRCTCYTASEGDITADGSRVREGIVAGKKDWLGCACVIYENDNGKVGDLIGVYEFKDTGNGIDTDGDGVGDTIQTGSSIDVYRDSLERCYAWIGDYGDYVYIQIIPADG